MSIRKGPSSLVAILYLYLHLHRQLKADLFTILDKFAEKVVQLHDL